MDRVPNAAKSIGNRFPAKKYIGAVVRKSSELELAAEIGPFEIFLPLYKKTHKTIIKSSIK